MPTEIIMILARSDNGVIGNDGKLPWHLPNDLKRFKTLTAASPMIMGRKTFESLPGVLPGRRHIVLTRDKSWNAKNAERAYDADSAIALADSHKIFIIGGAEIYKLFQNYANKIELTTIDIQAKGDIIIEPFNPAIWREIAKETNPATHEYPGHSFITLERK